jgi:tetratricopeptide (TPR) repeat protein
MTHDTLKFKRNTGLLTAILAFLLCILVNITYAETVNSADTIRINKLYHTGKSLHYSNPDSAIYYYQLVISDYNAVQKEIESKQVTDMDISYLETVIRALNSTGNIYYYDDQYKRSETYYQQSLNIAEQIGLTVYVAKALYDIGYIRYANNNYPDAIKLFKTSYARYAKTNNTEGMYCTLNANGLSHYRLGEFITADSLYQQALYLAQTLNDSCYISDVRIHLGILYCEQGRLDEGIMLFEQSLDYYEKSGNTDAVSDALLNIGVVMQMAGEYGKALKYMKESTGIAELSQVKSQMAVRYYHLADLYLDMRENEKAFEYCNKTLSVAEEIAAKPLATECNFLMGKYYMSEEMYKKAIDHFSTALSMVEKNNYKTLTANIYLWYAKAFLQLERIDEAIEKANSAYNEARALNLSTVKKDASYLLFKCFEKKGATGKALNWFEIYFNISDSINYYEQQKEIQRIEAHFNYEKQDRENEILRNKASLQEQLLKNRTITIFAMLLGIVLSIVTIILLISRMKYAKALNREQKMLSLQQLEQLNKELDGKKRELATKMMFLNQKNDLIGRIINQLQEIQNDPDVDYGEINSLVNELRNDAPQSNWKEFETQFVQVHPDFYKRLFKKYPDLTSYEQRICAFLRMNLNTKEIAAITGRSAKSIEVTRSRIRQKLQLSRKDNLGSFLASI